MGVYRENKEEAITEGLSQILSRCALYKPCLLMTFIGAGIGDTCIFPNERRSHLVHRDSSNNILKWSWKYNDVEKAYLTTNGLLLTNDDQVAFSDMRLKTKVDDYAIDIRDFVDAPLFTYYKKGSEQDGLRVGTSAQWMLDHMRLCVYGSEKDYYSYSYSRGGFILGVSIIKRLVPWMDKKDREIMELREENRELRRRVESLEMRQAC